MGILKQAISDALNAAGVKHQWLNTPPSVIETPAQAKLHDIQAVEQRPEHKYAPIVYQHNPSAYREKDTTLFLYVYDMENKKSVGYIAFDRVNIHVCRGCSFGEYNVWHRDKPSLVMNGRNAAGLTEATEYFERIFADDRYKFIITKAGKAIANEIMKGGKK